MSLELTDAFVLDPPPFILIVDSGLYDVDLEVLFQIMTRCSAVLRAQPKFMENPVRVYEQGGYHFFLQRKRTGHYLFFQMKKGAATFFHNHIWGAILFADSFWGQ